MLTVTSRDGTRIAYEKLGSGPPVVLVDGAFCGREFGPMPALSKLLAERYTVVHYDRRGRGASGDAPGYAVEREIEDLAAIVRTLDAAPCVYGCSSGAVLAARAVGGGVEAKRLALYEPPLALDGTHFPSPADYIARIDEHLSHDRRREAVKLFMSVVGMPRLMVWLMSLFPVFRTLESVAHTLRYDFAVLGDTQRGGPLPDELARALTEIRIPTLSLAGSKSPEWMKHASRVVAERVSGEKKTGILAGQDHNASAKAVAPALIEFFG